jgi:hypothetical protein
VSHLYSSIDESRALGKNAQNRADLAADGQGTIPFWDLDLLFDTMPQNEPNWSGSGNLEVLLPLNENSLGVPNDDFAPGPGV